MQFINKKKLNTGPARNATYNVAGGFTLVETLVAISIFTGAILGLLSFSAGSIGDNNYAKNKLIATYLAQEGAEYMRNLRDTYVLFQSNGWGTSDSDNNWDGTVENPPQGSFRNKLYEAGCYNDAGCYFDPAGLAYGYQFQPMKALVLTPCEPTCPAMLYDNSSQDTNKYNYTAGESTSFIRKIKVTNINNSDSSGNNKEIKIESTVSWKKANKDFSVSFSNYLKSWAE